VPDIPELSEKGAALVLMDGNKTFMHQSGSLAIDPGASPAAVIPVSGLLPHWQMGVFVHDKSFGQVPGFLFVSIMLLAIFIGVMVFGGVLLTRMTLRNMKDARQKTSFVSSVSHELKTPLTSIRMYAELLMSKRITDQRKIHTYLSVIVGESGRLTRLINNVLDFGRLEQGKKTYHPTCFELDRFLNRMIAVHGIRIQAQGLEIITRIEPIESTGGYHVRTDQDAVEQVVLNLIDNALKYAGDGEFIKFVLERQDAFILLKICDDGPGVPGAQREKIFEKFHRMDNSLTSQQPGSGLGFSIARQILRDLGGDLLLEPLPENGACFTARIKYHDPN
jgi:signal transduction histidine kinase